MSPQPIQDGSEYVIREWVLHEDEQRAGWEIERRGIRAGDHHLIGQFRNLQVSPADPHEIDRVLDSDHRTKVRLGCNDQGSADAKRCLQQIQRELQQVNPSGARSLEEGLEETLTMHRLGVPAELRTTLRTTNPIESAFSRVRTVCRNVKRWHPGDQRERWVGSGLIFAEQKFRRIVGYKALPKPIAILEAQTGLRKRSVRSRRLRNRRAVPTRIWTSSKILSPTKRTQAAAAAIRDELLLGRYRRPPAG